MSSRSRSRAVALCLSLVPGWGHVYWGRELRGLAVFTAFAVAGFALLNGAFIYLGPWRRELIGSSAVLLALVAAGSWVDIIRRTSPGRVRREAEERERSLREGTVAYLRGDLDAAASLFMISLESDPVDVEALFRLGIVRARAGDARAAAAWLRKAQKHDLEEKWRWEIRRELDRLKGSGGTPARSAPPPRRTPVPRPERETEGHPV